MAINGLKLEYCMYVFNILQIRSSHPTASLLSQKNDLLCRFLMYTIDLNFNATVEDIVSGLQNYYEKIRRQLFRTIARYNTS